MDRSGEVRSRVIQGCWQPESPLQKDSLVLPELFPHDFILRQALLGSYFLIGPSPSCMEKNSLRAHPRVAMPGQAGSVHCPRLSAWLTTHHPAKGPVWATCTTAGRSCTGLWAPHLSDFCFLNNKCQDTPAQFARSASIQQAQRRFRAHCLGLLPH